MSHADDLGPLAVEEDLIGVAWNARRQQWQARAIVDGRIIPVGHFATKELAAKAYDQFAVAMWGGEATLNSLPPPAIPPVSGGSPDAGASFANDLLASTVWRGRPVPPEADAAIVAVTMPADDREAAFLMAADALGMEELARAVRQMPLERVVAVTNALTGGIVPGEMEAAQGEWHVARCRRPECPECKRRGVRL